MKTINVSFEDSEMEALKKAKGEQSWHDFIIEGMEIGAMPKQLREYVEENRELTDRFRVIFEDNKR